jgi:predicted nucleotidyltransferase
MKHAFDAMLSIADRIKLRKRQLDRTVHALLAVCDAVPGIIAVYAYGSYAKGATGPTSDLDVLIVRDTSLRRLERDHDIRPLFSAPAGIDMLILTPQEYEVELPGNSVGQGILKEAVLLKRYRQVRLSSNAGE